MFSDDLRFEKDVILIVVATSLRRQLSVLYSASISNAISVLCGISMLLV